MDVTGPAIESLERLPFARRQAAEGKFGRPILGTAANTRVKPDQAWPKRPKTDGPHHQPRDRPSHFNDGVGIPKDSAMRNNHVRDRWFPKHRRLQANVRRERAQKM
jgi:hypothetical protein